MVIAEKPAKSILSRSQVFDYVVNPYIGCQHGCSYCYARFMKRFTGHREPWGDFVDVKINAPELLKKELLRKRKGTIWVSGVCDPYQPVERRYRLTRRCLEILATQDWPVVVQTRSPLVTRDIDVLQGIEDLEVGLTITTADDAVRKAFEPKAPPVDGRIEALGSLREAGIRTFAMIAPILPGAEGLIARLAGKVAYVILDRMNYGGASAIYRKHGWKGMCTDEYFAEIGELLLGRCRASGIECRSVY